MLSLLMLTIGFALAFVVGSNIPLYLALAFGAVDLVFWIIQGTKMSKSGHVPWRRSITGRIIWNTLTPLVRHLFVGDITVLGREKLRKLRGRRVYVQNHTFQMDFNLAATATRDHFFFMTKTAELGGIRGLFGALTGAISVNTKEPNGGAAAVKASVKALLRGVNRSLLIFPQGGLKEQFPLKRDEFQNGAVRIAQAVQAESNEDVFVVPIGTCYIRTDAKRARNVRSNFLAKCRRAFGVTNVGAAIVVGDPIPVASLPSDADKATDIVFAQVEALTQQAMELAERRRKALLGE